MNKKILSLFSAVVMFICMITVAGVVFAADEPQSLTFGIYPQSKVTDIAVINSVKDKVSFAESSNFVDFSDGNNLYRAVKSGESFNLYIYEQIEWIKLGDIYVTKNIIDASAFDADNSKYSESDLRNFIDNTICKTAFSDNDNFTQTEILAQGIQFDGEGPVTDSLYNDVNIQDYTFIPDAFLIDESYPFEDKINNIPPFECKTEFIASSTDYASDNGASGNSYFLMNADENDGVWSVNSTGIATAVSKTAVGGIRLCADFSDVSSLGDTTYVYIDKNDNINLFDNIADVVAFEKTLGEQFIGWNNDPENATDGIFILTPKDKEKVTINCYKEAPGLLEGDESYELFLSSTVDCKIGSDYTEKPEIIQGYYINEERSVLSVNVIANSNPEIKVYYSLYDCKVNVYQEKLPDVHGADSEYSLSEVYIYKGELGETEVYSPADITGFSINEALSTASYSAVYNEQNTAEINIYYDRNIHKVTWTADAVIEEENYKYGETITVIDDPPICSEDPEFSEYFELSGWDGLPEDKIMRDENIDAVAYYNPIIFPVYWYASEDDYENNKPMKTTSFSYFLYPDPPESPQKSNSDFVGWHDPVADVIWIFDYDESEETQEGEEPVYGIFPPREMSLIAYFEDITYNINWYVENLNATGPDDKWQLVTTTTGVYKENVESVISSQEFKNIKKSGYDISSWTYPIPEYYGANLKYTPASEESGYPYTFTDKYGVVNYNLLGTWTASSKIAILNYDDYDGRTLMYNTSMTIRAEVTNPPDDTKIEWIVENADFTDNGDGSITIKNAKQNFTVQASVKNSDGDLIKSEVETIKIKSGFFDRIKSFCWKILFSVTGKQRYSLHKVQ